MFVEKIGTYGRRGMWTICDAREGTLVGLHNMYMRSSTTMKGYVAPRCTAAVPGMGTSKRALTTTKLIRYGRRSGLLG
jgi:hypothetical protein